MEKVDAKTIKKTVDEIPETALVEVYNYLEFLKWRATKTEIKFNAWARNLAREKGFSHLTENDVMKIVKECRGEANA